MVIVLMTNLATVWKVVVLKQRKAIKKESLLLIERKTLTQLLHENTTYLEKLPVTG